MSEMARTRGDVAPPPPPPPDPDTLGIANAWRRMFGGGGGDVGSLPPVPVRRQAPTMRQSEVAAQLARFLAGMRALERQRAEGGGRGQSTGQTAGQPLPPLLSEFIVWAGDTLAGEERGRSGGGGTAARGQADVETAARGYLGGGGVAPTSAAAVPTSADDDENRCCICLDDLGRSGGSRTSSDDASPHGEPVTTACGHRFHAACFARLMETSEHEPLCPMCRTSNVSARFGGRE